MPRKAIFLIHLCLNFAAKTLFVHLHASFHCWALHIIERVRSITVDCSHTECAVRIYFFVYMTFMPLCSLSSSFVFFFHRVLCLCFLSCFSPCSLSYLMFFFLSFFCFLLLLAGFGIYIDDASFSKYRRVVQRLAQQGKLAVVFSDESLVRSSSSSSLSPYSSH